MSEENNDSQHPSLYQMIQQKVSSRTTSEDDQIKIKKDKKFSLSQEDFDNQLDSSNKIQGQFPSQSNRKLLSQHQLTVESNLINTTNSDKFYYSKSQDGNELQDETQSEDKGLQDQFDKKFIQSELKEMQEICLANQRYMEQIDKKYKLKGRNTLKTDASEIKNISAIQKNISINQDLSFTNCDRMLKFSEIEISAKLQQLIQENMALQQINETLQKELNDQRNHLLTQGENSTVQREIQIKNNQITELQKKILEIEKEQVENQSGEIAQIQCLEQKCNQLMYENKKLQNKLSSISKEYEQLLEKLGNENNKNIQKQFEDLQKEFEEYKQQQNAPNSAREEYYKIKSEFEEFQLVTQNIINQEEEYQRRINELEDEVSNCQQVQEELIQTLREKEELFSQRFRELKSKFQEDLQIQKRQFEQQEEYLKEQTSYLFQQLSQSEASRTHLEQIFNKEIEAARQYSQQQCIIMEQQIKKMYEKQLSDKNQIIFEYEEKLQKFSKNNLCLENDPTISVHRSKSLSSQGLLKNYFNNYRQTIPSSKMVNQSFDDDQFGKIKSNNNTVYQNSGQKRNTSYTQQKPSKYTNLSIDKENQNDQGFKHDSNWKPKSNLYLKQLESNGIRESSSSNLLLNNQPYINSNFNTQSKYLNNQQSKTRYEQTNQKNYINENNRLLGVLDSHMKQQQPPKHPFSRKQI